MPATLTPTVVVAGSKPGTVVVDDAVALHPPFHPGATAHPGRGNETPGSLQALEDELPVVLPYVFLAHTIPPTVVTL